jgi:glycosyltransferase involved in cell wall biosynthesis
MRIAFVIPAHNEELLIGRTVAACAAAGRECGEEFEIVVACDACTDRTAEIARAGGARVVEVNKRIIAGVRNAGARAAMEGGAELMLFVDADTSPPVASVREAIEFVKGGAIGGGAPVAMDGPVPFYARMILWLLNRVFRLLRWTGGCFLYCTQAGYEAVGGWDETLLVSEEITMANALKQRGRFEIVRTPVVTSGRKLRTYSAMEVVSLLVRGTLMPGLRRDRKQLDLWYGPRREDPFEAQGEGGGGKAEGKEVDKAGRAC